MTAEGGDKPSLKTKRELGADRVGITALKRTTVECRVHDYLTSQSPQALAENVSTSFDVTKLAATE